MLLRIREVGNGELTVRILMFSRYLRRAARFSLAVSGSAKSGLSGVFTVTLREIKAFDAALRVKSWVILPQATCGIRALKELFFSEGRILAICHQQTRRGAGRIRVNFDVGSAWPNQQPRSALELCVRKVLRGQNRRRQGIQHCRPGPRTVGRF